MFPGGLARRIPSALRRLGFRFVGETAEGARLIAEKSFSQDSGSICSACPAVVNYVEKYRPELTGELIKAVSPMVAHARMIKSKNPGCAVVFIGPCAAKKQEAHRPENEGTVDVVLMYSEFSEWLKAEDIQLEECAESSFDTFGEIGDARLFPIQGGMLKSGGILCDGTDESVLHMSGAEDVIGMLGGKPSSLHGKIVEPLFCKGGCVGGPAFGGDTPLFERRARVIEYARSMGKRDSLHGKTEIPTLPVFIPSAPPEEDVSESQINKILEGTGKGDPALRLNCGACGY
jgi:iron only hydrogenase large subunit-like protein